MKSNLFFSVLTAAVLFLPAQLLAEGEFTDSLETEFVSNGKLTINLSAGDHEITASPDKIVRVHWRAYSHDRDHVNASTDVDGSSATIEVDGPRRNFHTIIEVPQHSNLTVRLSAGDLRVGDIQGDHDIRLKAGDLSIEVGNPDDYASVAGSLWAGDIDATPFSQEVSGLFRSIDWQGEGRHNLRFKLYAGDVRLFQVRDR